MFLTRLFAESGQVIITFLDKNFEKLIFLTRLFADSDFFLITFPAKNFEKLQYIFLFKPSQLEFSILRFSL